MLTDKEIALARASMQFALENGAQKVRVTLNKSLMELFGMLNGELDKVTHALDRSLQVSLFVDGRFGSFSSNRLEEEGLKAFLLGAIDTVRTLEPDAGAGRGPRPAGSFPHRQGRPDRKGTGPLRSRL